jgi:hypothetical protein
MSLKNYSTNIPTAKTIMEIEDILTKHRATDIWKHYDTNGNIIALNFAVNTDFGKMPFKLPVNVEAVRQILKSEKKSKKINLSKQQIEDVQTAQRIAWRIMKDWIDAQMALIDISMVKLEQVFLPYAFDFNKNQSLYDEVKERKFAGMLMEQKN